RLSPAVVRSDVWLQMLDRCLVFQAQGGYSHPLLSRLGLRGLDREGRESFDIGRNAAAEPSDVQLVDDMVQRSAQVEQAVPDCYRELVDIKRWKLAVTI